MLLQRFISLYSFYTILLSSFNNFFLLLLWELSPTVFPVISRRFLWNMVHTDGQCLISVWLRILTHRLPTYLQSQAAHCEHWLSITNLNCYFMHFCTLYILSGEYYIWLLLRRTIWLLMCLPPLCSYIVKAVYSSSDLVVSHLRHMCRSILGISYDFYSILRPALALLSG